MAITESRGYADDIDKAEWAEILWRIGASRYGVASYADWLPTIGAGAGEVALAAGIGWGAGVLDIATASSVTIPEPSTGVRWDLIVARRNWGSGTTTFDRVEGGSVIAIPTRETTPGVLDEQPIALAKRQAGASAVLEIIDLRLVVGSGGALAFHELARAYLTDLGTQLRIGNTRSTRVRVGSAEQWAHEDVTDTGWLTDGLSINIGSAWDLSSYRLRKLASRILGRVVVRRGSAASEPTADSSGAFSAASSVLRLPTGWRSPVTETPVMRGVETGVPLFPSMDPEGLVTVERALPGQQLSRGGRFIVEFDHPYN